MREISEYSNEQFDIDGLDVVSSEEVIEFIHKEKQKGYNRVFFYTHRNELIYIQCYRTRKETLYEQKVREKREETILKREIRVNYQDRTQYDRPNPYNMAHLLRHLQGYP